MGEINSIFLCFLNQAAFILLLANSFMTKCVPGTERSLNDSRCAQVKVFFIPGSSFCCCLVGSDGIVVTLTSSRGWGAAAAAGSGGPVSLAQFELLTFICLVRIIFGLQLLGKKENLFKQLIYCSDSFNKNQRI